MSELAKKWVRHSIQAVATLLQNANFKGFFEGKIVLQISDVEALEQLIGRLKAIEGIMEVVRID